MYPKIILDGIGAFLGFTTVDANDATAATSPSHDLPPNPFAGNSSPTLRQSTAPIDLTSPTTSPKRPHGQAQLADAARPPAIRKRKSDNESRQPADAVSLPCPTPGYKYKGSMVSKPGSQSSFQPLNTLAGNPAPSQTTRPRPKTYSSRQPPIGRSQYAGQKAYAELPHSRLQATPTKDSPTRNRHAQQSGGTTSAKRRKTEHVIDLSGNDEDEVQEVSPTTVFSPAGTSYDKPYSARSSQSRQSVRSEATLAEFKTSQPTSEFREADSMLRPNPPRKPRKQSNKTQGARTQSPFAGGALSPGSVNNMNGTSDAHRAILQNFQQGIHDAGNQRPHSNGTVTSSFFPESRINESTARNTASNRPVADLTSDLRHQHRPVPKRAELVDDDYSADELASAAPTTARKQTMSPSKVRQTAKGGSKQKNQSPRSKNPSKRWPLVFARTYGYERHCSNPDDNETELSLRTDADGWRVTTRDSTEGTWSSHVTITTQDFNKAQADKIGKIRLEGPRGQDGNSSIFDLQFANTPDFLAFCDNIAGQTIKGSCNERTEDLMSTLFNKPLPARNAKVGTTELVPEPNTEAANPDSNNSNTSKKPLLAGLNREHGSTSLITTEKTSSRPVRSTRSAPTHETTEPLESPKVEKYSVDVGLGTPWIRPLEYGQGRQRAVVYFDDLPKLDEEDYLNDDLINFYMTYLFTKLEVPSDKVYFFNTHFYTKLTEKAGRNIINYQAVARWTSRVDIFSYDYIVVPINENFHWYLAIICNVSNIERKPVTRDEDADLTQSLEESRKESAGVTATDKSEGVETPQPVSSPKHSTPAPKETLDEQNDDDTNLFEESLLLVDRNDMGAEVQPVNTNEGIPVLHPSGTEPVEVEQFIAHAKGVAEGILSNPTASPAKSKSKRKLAQPRKDPNKPIVIVLDSLGQPHSGAARALKSWITAEGDARRAINATIKENAYYPKGAQIPTQENFTDCGVYLLGYVEKFFQDPDSFKNKLLTGAMSSEEDWPELKPKEMRAKMRDIIFKCHKEQEENRKAEKKIKKGVMSVKTPSRPVSREPAKADSNAPLTGQPPSEESKVQRSKVEDTQDQHLSTAQRIGETARPRLASPINFTQRPAESSDHSPPVVISKVSDSPPVATSPSRPPSVAPRTNRTPRRVSPEVRILVKTPMSSSSIRSGQNIPIGGSPKNEDRHDIGKAPSSVTPKKRPRQDENDGQFASPATKRQSTRSPRQQGVNHSTNPLARGSSSNEPIEIGDSQDGASMVSQDLKHPQAKSVAQRQPPSRSIRPNPSFCPLSSSEEIQPPSAEKRRQQQSEESFLGRELEASLEQDAMMRSEAQQEEARSPQIEILRSQPILRHIQEADHDPMDLDSQPADLMDVNKLALDSNSTIEMEMDDANDTVIRETPELESKSPNSQMLV